MKQKPECCDDCHTSDDPYKCKLFGANLCDTLNKYKSDKPTKQDESDDLQKTFAKDCKFIDGVLTHIKDGGRVEEYKQNPPHRKYCYGCTVCSSYFYSDVKQVEYNTLCKICALREECDILIKIQDIADTYNLNLDIKISKCDAFKRTTQR